MTTSTSPLHSPGQLIANLPGILGFYPNESVIFAAFRATGHGHRHQLGPVMRVDIDDLHVLPEVAAGLDRDGHGLVFCFLVTEREAAEVESVIDELLAVAEADLIPIRACWLTRRILTGEPVHLVFGPDMPQAGDADPGGQWTDGVIAPVAQAESMGPLLDQGELPELTREECFDHFARFNPGFSPEEADLLTDFARRHAEEVQQRTTRHTGSPGGQRPWDSVAGIVADFGLLLREIEDDGVSTESLMADEEAMAGTATLMAGVQLRDAVIEDVLDHPRPASRLMLAVARTFGGDVRANALCGYALAALELNLSMRAMPALIAAQAESPGHSFSALLLDTCRVGAFGQLVDAARRGSRIVRQAHGVADPVGDCDAA